MTHFGYKHTEEAKRKISNSMKGRKLSATHKNKISESMKGCNGPFFGKTHTENTKNKISKSQQGERGHCWKGGVSSSPYCKKFNREFKDRVRKFFNYVCVECGKSQAENNKKLDVHHVNFDKMSCCNENKPLFVALCQRCHSKTQKDREYWKNHFIEIINEKYGGRCFAPKDINSNL